MKILTSSGIPNKDHISTFICLFQVSNHKGFIGVQSLSYPVIIMSREQIQIITQASIYGVSIYYCYCPHRYIQSSGRRIRTNSIGKSQEVIHTAYNGNLFVHCNLSWNRRVYCIIKLGPGGTIIIGYVKR